MEWDLLSVKGLLFIGGDTVGAAKAVTTRHCDGIDRGGASFVRATLHQPWLGFSFPILHPFTQLKSSLVLYLSSFLDGSPNRKPPAQSRGRPILGYKP